MQVSIPVLKMKNLLNYINNIEGEVRLTKADIEYFYMLLNKNNIINKEERKNHMNFVKEKKMKL